MSHARQPEEIPLNSWVEFEPTLRKIRDATRTQPGEPGFKTTLFRGHGNSGWKLDTTLDRAHPNERLLLNYYWKASCAQPALETLSGKRWDRLPTIPEFKKRLEEHDYHWLDQILSFESEVYEYLVYLRHHCFPSPLLDWTASPYVAAFFAFDEIRQQTDTVCVIAVLRGHLSSYSGDMHCSFVGPYISTDPRHVLQQSHYSTCLGHKDEQVVFKSHEEGIWDAVGVGNVIKITIPTTERRSALEHLDSMNINPFSLFGTEDSLVRTIARRELEFRDWSL